MVWRYRFAEDLSGDAANDNREEAVVDGNEV